ncbi:MAG TPA: preprotein translocase subunit SecE [Solirubrobacteraceae bacterium]|nr:preprotein translocase subunit SecE [Solirubrobacteraceae bacterium]
MRQAQPVASGRGRERRPLDGAQEREERSEPTAAFGTPVPISGSEPEDGAPDPIEHATPDVELAELQLATASRLEAPLQDTPDEDTLEAEPEAAEAEPGGSVDARSTPVPATASTVAAPRPWLGARLLGFLEGSWRELQRVQWPDRRQVMQATGVVIGFVIVASVFLGLADLVASKVVSFILKGHF